VGVEGVAEGHVRVRASGRRGGCHG
jgi:hypothetical protein